MSSQPPAASLIPVIHTERLILRAHTPNDFLTSAALWADSHVTRFIGGRPLSEEEVWARLLRYARHWSWMGFGYWVIEEKLTGAFVGEMGFADWKRDIEPSLQGVPELGWVLAADFHGKGFATEVVRAALSYYPNDLVIVGWAAALVYDKPDATSAVIDLLEYANTQLLEFRCQEFVEELAFGHLRRQQLVKHYEGDTLNIDITRKIPNDPAILYQRDYVMPPRK